MYYPCWHTHNLNAEGGGKIHLRAPCAKGAKSSLFTKTVCGRKFWLMENGEPLETLDALRSYLDQPGGDDEICSQCRAKALGHSFKGGSRVWNVLRGE